MFTNFLQFTQETFLYSFLKLWNGIISIIPNLLGAIIIFILGWFVGKLAYKAILKISHALKIDEATKPLSGTFERAGYKLHFGKVIGTLVKWFIVIGSLVISLEILGLSGVASLLLGIVVVRIPQVIIAILILLAGILVANFVKKLILGSTQMLNVKSAAFLANLARIAIIVFTVLIALNTIQVDSNTINTLFIGFVAMFALAGGLAFGLGGQKAAAQAIEDAKAAMRK